MTNTLDKFQILKNAFGYESFRGKQAEAIDSVMAGRDVLMLAPTGQGKSAAFQIPALMLDGAEWHRHRHSHIQQHKLRDKLVSRICNWLNHHTAFHYLTAYTARRS